MNDFWIWSTILFSMLCPPIHPHVKLLQKHLLLFHFGDRVDHFGPPYLQFVFPITSANPSWILL